MYESIKRKETSRARYLEAIQTCTLLLLSLTPKSLGPHSAFGFN